MADSKDKGLSVQIFGKEYHLAGDPERGDDHIREVAAIVDERMRQIDREHGSQSAYHKAILAGLDLVDELLRLKAQLSAAQEEISARTSRLSASLGRVLGDAAATDETSKDDAVEWLDVNNERRAPQTATPPSEQRDDDGEGASRP